MKLICYTFHASFTWLTVSAWLINMARNSWGRKYFETLLHPSITISTSSNPPMDYSNRYQRPKEQGENTEGDFLHHLYSLKESVISDSTVIAGNMQRMTSNFNQIFNYINVVLTKTTLYVNQLKQSYYNLQKKLIQYNPQDPILKEELYYCYEYQRMLKEAKMRFSLTPILPFSDGRHSKQHNSFHQKLQSESMREYQNSVEEKYPPHYLSLNHINDLKPSDQLYPNENKILQERKKMITTKDEYRNARAWVRENFLQNLQIEPTMTETIDKSAFVNSYLRFKEKSGEKIPYYCYSTIKLGITHLIKDTFPGVIIQLKNYQGLRFKTKDQKEKGKSKFQEREQHPMMEGLLDEKQNNKQNNNDSDEELNSIHE